MNWRMVAVLFAALAVMYLLVSVASADESTVDEVPVIFSAGDECRITTRLKVLGSDTARCIDYLDTATRLAKAERLVNRKKRVQR